MKKQAQLKEPYLFFSFLFPPAKRRPFPRAAAEKALWRRQENDDRAAVAAKEKRPSAHSGQTLAIPRGENPEGIR